MGKRLKTVFFLIAFCLSVAGAPSVATWSTEIEWNNDFQEGSGGGTALVQGITRQTDDVTFTTHLEITYCGGDKPAWDAWDPMNPVEHGDQVWFLFPQPNGMSRAINVENFMTVGRQGDTITLDFDAMLHPSYQDYVNYFGLHAGRLFNENLVLGPWTYLQNTHFNDYNAGGACAGVPPVVTTTSTTTSTTVSTNFVSTTTSTIPFPLPNSVNVTFRYTPWMYGGVERCVIYSDLSGSWAPTFHRNSVEDGVQDSVTRYNVADGVYHWNVWCENQTDYEWIERENWTFRVCLNCKNCFNDCRDSGYDYGLCRQGCFVDEYPGSGICNDFQSHVCCCGVNPTTTTSSSTTTTTMHFVPPNCGDGVVQFDELEACDTGIPVPATCTPQDYCCPPGFSCVDCSCVSSGGLPTSTTSSTTLQSSTTTSTTTSSTVTSTTTSSTTTTLIEPIQFNFHSKWNQNLLTNNPSDDAYMRVSGDLRPYMDGNIVLNGSIRFTRCSGDVGLWRNFNPSASPYYFYYYDDSVNPIQVIHMWLEPSATLVTDDEIYFEVKAPLNPSASKETLSFRNGDFIDDGDNTLTAPSQFWFSWDDSWTYPECTP